MHQEPQGLQPIHTALRGKTQTSAWGQNFFSNKIIDDWNDLPVSIKGVTNLNTFKDLINELLCEKQNEQAVMKLWGKARDKDVYMPLP